MKELQNFKNAQFGQIRATIAENGEPLFCLSDICKALNLNGGARNVTQRLSPKGVVSINTPTNGGNQQMTFITESNFYKCVFQSRKKQAEMFQDWVTSEVLPAIRRDGGYMAVREDESEEDLMARALVVAKNTLKRREERIKQLENEKEQKQRQIETQSAQISELSHAVEEMQPKVSYLELIMQDKGRTLTVTEIAQDYGISAKAFNKILEGYRVQRRVNGVWIVYAPYLKEG